MTTVQREAARQQMLLRAIWRDSDTSAVKDWCRLPPGDTGTAALGAYRGNAGALAERALATSFPTVAALVGTGSFGALARDFWHHEPPLRGDLGEWGAGLPDFIAASEQLASEPYLADCARLDWLVHQALRAADAPRVPPDLAVLGSRDPAHLVLQLASGAALLASAWPVATLWQAHQQADDAPERFAPVRAALARGGGEHAFVCREAFAVRVHALDEAEAAFSAALVTRQPLSAALDAAGDLFAFDQWLARAFGSGWLVGVLPSGTPASP